MKLSDMAINEKIDDAGEWVELYGSKMDGVKVKVRPTENRDDRKVQMKMSQRLLGKYRTRRGSEIPAEVLEQIETERLVEALLVDWQGIEDENGNELPYDKDRARFILTNPQYRRFREAVLLAAERVEDENKKEEEEAVKN